MKDYGGKANSLLKLKENNINVPNFFIIDEQDYVQFLKACALVDKISLLFERKDYKEIQKCILSSRLDKQLVFKIKNKFRKLNCQKVSVRSSASNEDGKFKSFAGQYYTSLNIDEGALEESIKKCWCSLYEKNVSEYEERPNIFGMNVIIQQMIEADYAGVAFSIDPTDDKNNYSIIEIVEGLGESLVSGEKTPSKFLVRRQTKNIDLKIGKINIDDQIIINLEKMVLKIERIYGFPVDIEYAIKDSEIFILQARPISKMIKSIKPFSLSVTRPYSIIEQEIYFKGEFDGIKNLTRGLYYFRPLFIYRPYYETVEVFYNYLDLEEDPRLIYRELDCHYDDFLEQYYIAVKNIDEISDKIRTEKVDIEEISRLLVSLYPFSDLGQLAGSYRDITKRVKEVFLEYRNHYDRFIYDTCVFLEDKIREELSEEYQSYISFLTLEEITCQKPPSIKILEERKKGYIYFGQLYTTDHYEKWLEDHKICIIDDEAKKDNLKGEVACSLSVSGRVCKVFSEKDFKKFKEGDLLVTPMTVPKFIEVIKKSKGIITDEGGITCHASIVAREMQIPCVVGCKNATKVLNDGDFVQIDGSTGVIKIIN